MTVGLEWSGPVPETVAWGMAMFQISDEAHNGAMGATVFWRGDLDRIHRQIRWSEEK